MYCKLNQYFFYGRRDVKRLRKVTACLTVLLFMFVVQTNTVQAQTTVTVTYTTPGSGYTLTIPGTASVYIDAWGGGGGGGVGAGGIVRGGYGGGGGGGGYVGKYLGSMIGNLSITVANGGAGGDYSFASNASGDAGGTSSISYGTVTYMAGGGEGGEGVTMADGHGGYGGVCQAINDMWDSAEEGMDGAGRTGNCSGAGGNGAHGGGAGGASQCSSADGYPGNAPGGGGSGGRAGLGGAGGLNGGNGAPGQVVITMSLSVPSILSTGTHICGSGSVLLWIGNSISDATYTWYKDGVNVGTGQSYTATAAGSYTAIGTYNISYSGGSPSFYPSSSVTTTASNPLIVTAGMPILINPFTLSDCSGTNFSITPTNGTDGSVPTGTIYSWTVSSNTGVTGAGAISGNSGSSSTITLGTLTNSTNAVQTIVYDVTPTGDGCTGDVFQITVKVKPIPQPDNIVTTACSGENINITPNSGLIPDGTTYSWTIISNEGVGGASAGSFGNSSTISLGTLTNTGSTSKQIKYTVTPVSNGCQGNDFSITVNVTPAITIALTSDAAAYCNGGNTILTAVANPAGVYQYDWYLDNVLILANGGNTYTSSEPFRSSAYNYYVVVHTGTCEGTSNTVPVKVNNAPVVTVSINHTDICPGGSVTAKANVMPTGDYYYTWYLDGNIIDNQQQTVIENLSPGTHSIYVKVSPVTNSEGCDVSSAPININVHNNPVVTIVADENSICAGGTATIRTDAIVLDTEVTDASSFTYQWAVNGVVVPTAIMNTYSRTLTTPGTYSFTMRMIQNNDFGCASEWSAPAVVTVEAIPQVALTVDDNTYCVGGSALLTVAAIPAGTYQYDWYRDNVLILANGGNTYTSSEAAQSSPYNYRVIARSALGCEGQSNDVSIYVKPIPVVTVITDQTDICPGGSVTVKANVVPAGDYSYTWYLDGNIIDNQQQTVIANLSPNTHSVYVKISPLTDASGCDVSSAPVNINVHNNPVVTIVADENSICAGGTATIRTDVIVLDAEVTDASSFTYQWAVNGVIIPTAFMSTYTQILTTPGTYSFTMRMIQNNDFGCASEWSAPAVVTVEAIPQVLLTVDDNTYCTDGSALLTAATIPAGTYQYDWYRDDVLILANGGNTYTSSEAAQSSPYNYRVIARSALGCEGQSNDVSIYVKPIPVVTVITDQTDICPGGSVTANANVVPAGDYSYTWYLDGNIIDNQQQTVIDNLLPGTHSVYVTVSPVTNSEGCDVSSAEVYINVYDNPVVTISADNTLLCSSGTVTLTVTDVTLNSTVSDNSHLTYQWAINGNIINGQTGNICVQSLDAGEYEFTARVVQNDNLGCASDWSTPVTVIVMSIDVPQFFTTDCDENNVGTYRTVQLPITVYSGNPQQYTATFVDAAQQSFNYSGSIQNSLIELHLPLQAGDYAIIIDIDGCKYPTTIRVRADGASTTGASLIEERWDDVLTVNNNPQNNGGFNFYAYQWYKNDILIPGANNQYYTEPDGKLDGEYYVVLNGYAILANGNMVEASFTTCPFKPAPDFNITVYPVPVKQNQPVKITTSLSADDLIGAVIEIYNETGVLLQTVTNLTTQISVEGFNTTGIYFGRLITVNKGTYNFKLIVTQ